MNFWRTSGQRRNHIPYLCTCSSRITVIGEFNDWQEWELNKTYDGNFWECYAKGAKPGMRYKYRIYRQDGNCVEHCDPYGFGMELRPNFASIIRDLSHYKFKDEQMDAETFGMQGQATQYLRPGFRII